MKTRQSLLSVAFMLIAVVSALPAAADYQFIVSGYPSDNPHRTCESSVVVLETSTISRQTSPQPLDARFCSWFAATIEKLNTLPRTGFLLLVK